MTSPRISVALSVHNNAAYLTAALDSILAQSFRDYELLVVDDGSTDASPAILDHYATRDPRIRVMHQANRGLIASLNRILAMARGDYIARMDGDDIALPERFARQLAFLDTHADHGVVGTQIQGITERGLARRGYVVTHPTDPDAVAEALASRSPLCHPSTMMRRGLVYNIGGYRAAYQHCEDYDLWLRLVDRTRMANLPDRLMLYRYSATQVSTRHVLAQHFGASVARLARAERLAGRPDPTDGLTVLPPVETMDLLFGQPGVAARIRADVTRGILYSPHAMANEGRALIVAHLADVRRSIVPAVPGLWRAVARLMRHHQPAAGVSLAATLALHGVRR